MSGPVQAAELLLKQAGESCELSLCEQSITIFQGLLFLNFNQLEVHYQLGVCLSGACQSHSLVNTEAALGHFRSALSHSDSSTPPLSRARILGALGNAYSNSSMMSRLDRLEAAIGCHQQAAGIYLDNGKLDDWGREQNNLGLAKCELPEEYPNKWHEAIDHFEQALFVRTKENNPLGQAATLQNLGTAWRALPGGNKRCNVRKAIDCYQRAFRAYRGKAFRQKRATLHNNLGNAYLSLAATGERRNLNVRRALRHFSLALKTFTRHSHPREYAVSQFNRGQAFLELSNMESSDYLVQASVCLSEAKHSFTACNDVKPAQKAEELLGRLKLKRNSFC